MIKYYLEELLEPTILFGIFSALLGLSAALYYSHFNWPLAILVVLGVALAHISVNLVDDYTDYKKGIDKETIKTKFSGGSKVLSSGKIKPRALLGLAIALALMAGAIGLFLLSVNIILLPIIVIGAITIFFYAAYLVRVPFLAEPITALNFTLISVGSFIVAYGSGAMLHNALFAMIPAGMMVGIILMLNSIPDKSVDKKYGRRSGVVILGTREKIAVYYLAWEAAACIIILYGIISRALPATFLITLLTVPIALKVYGGIRNYKSPALHEKTMGTGALFTLGFILLCSVSYLLAMVI
ncbi:MAG: prenyltransferase [Candidatus Micrarchaeota archaeon]|nr:prenyltransferase [Candidatus Micrarchaeota archaeon]MDE1848369.1 prenyltransferase [Candidatus Micrarchaeota archaeon]MDE1864806.1 prenyltransferase [Candidatus Micrarchaeota archaeon]